MIRIRSPQDFGAALLFLAIGAGGLWFGREYAVGTVARIGPGYVPALMSWGLIGLGALLAVRSLAWRGPAIEAGALRPVALILASILVFAGMIEHTGLLAAGAVSLAIAGCATTEVRRREIVLLAVLFSVFCTVLFVYALSQPIPVWGPRP